MNPFLAGVQADVSKNLTPFFPSRTTIYSSFPKLILVVIKEQFLAAYEYGELRFCLPVSSGTEKELTPKEYLRKHGIWPTPRGEFFVFFKTKIHYSSIFPIPSGGDSMPYTLCLAKGTTPFTKERCPVTRLLMAALD